jgi:hypothetical protein
MAAEPLQVQVVLTGGESDSEALADSVLMLATELAELDVDTVEPAIAGDAPAGAKGVELLALGALVVKLARSAPVLRGVVRAIRDWAGRTETRTVSLTVDGDVLELTGASSSEVKALIDAWVERHAES